MTNEKLVQTIVDAIRTDPSPRIKEEAERAGVTVEELAAEIRDTLLTRLAEDESV